MRVVPAAAREEPLWRRASASRAAFPHYRGSDVAQLPLPVPCGVYRGDFFKADRYGALGPLTEWVDVN
jgi:hypothetical protein